jgi:hypothetical protein
MDLVEKGVVCQTTSCEWNNQSLPPLMTHDSQLLQSGFLHDSQSYFQVFLGGRRFLHTHSETLITIALEIYSYANMVDGIERDVE